MDDQPARAGSDAHQYLTSPSKIHREQQSMLAQLQLSEGLPLSICTPVHQGAPLPANESARLEGLNRLGVLDSDQDQRFDDITALVCSLFNVPIAIVSLVDKERQWFKSCVGLNCSQTDRKSSFCAWTLVPKNPEVLVVPDATEDARCLTCVLCNSAATVSTMLTRHMYPVLQCIHTRCMWLPVTISHADKV